MRQIAAWLTEHAALWKPRPFVGDRVPVDDGWLAGLDHAAIDRIEVSGLPLEAPAELRAIEREARAFDVRVSEGARASEDFRGVRERKRGQVAAFADAVEVVAPIVDWCGGKGHLGRVLTARSGRAVTVVDVVDYGIDLPFVRADVLSGAADGLLVGAHGVALHACGALGVRLLEVGARAAEALALAPCCLHKGPWRTLSRVGAETNPGIDHSALRLATADEVVARPALRAGRRRENGFRLGLDALVREAGCTRYTPLGTLPHDLVRADFATFVRGVAELRGLTLPDRWDPNEWEARGHALALRARALGVVRSLFKRAIELWVVADRAAFLEETGFVVSVTAFCPRAVTPRNLLVTARRA